MPRKRTSTAKPKERAKLRTVHEVQLEIRKLYRRYSNGEIGDAHLKSRVATLTALRSGMAEPVEQPDPAAGFTPGFEHLNIISVPHNWIVISMLGEEAHIPRTLLPQLRELLPPGSIGRPPSADGVLPPLPVGAELPDEITSLLDGDRPVEPPPAA